MGQATSEVCYWRFLVHEYLWAVHTAIESSRHASLTEELQTSKLLIFGLELNGYKVKGLWAIMFLPLSKELFASKNVVPVLVEGSHTRLPSCTIQLPTWCHCEKCSLHAVHRESAASAKGLTYSGHTIFKHTIYILQSSTKQRQQELCPRSTCTIFHWASIWRSR